LTGRNILFTTTANKKGTLSKIFNKVKKKMFLFFNSSFVYEICGNLQSLLTGSLFQILTSFWIPAFAGMTTFYRFIIKA